MKKILFIAPLPPPATGMANASLKILEKLSDKYLFDIVNFSKRNFKHGFNSIRRFTEILGIIRTVKKKVKDCDLVYLTISQSVAGNLKDLLLLFICRKKRRVIHLHGGGIGRLIYDRKPILFFLNKRILKTVDKVIVLGDSLKRIFRFLPPEKIAVVNNYAEDYFFLDNFRIEKKYKNSRMEFLFLSNLIPGKGYMELVEAFLLLNEEFKNDIALKFAGGFEDDHSREVFLEKIHGNDNIMYCGVIKDEERVPYFSAAQVFCLPTYYPYEGQPISILEAYAAGSVVVTTDHAGICDIFMDRENGYLVQKRSVESLYNILKQIIIMYRIERESLIKIAVHNLDSANTYYNENKYANNMDAIFSFLIDRNH